MADRVVSVVSGLVGRPWAPPAFDCYSFVCAVYLAAYGIELPPLVRDAGQMRSAMEACGSATAAAATWHQVPAPASGDVVVMGRGRAPYHCGVWLPIEGGRIAHCCDPLGVVVQPRRAMVAAGWGGFLFFRHVQRLSSAPAKGTP